jgi:hypothetical protein
MSDIFDRHDGFYFFTEEDELMGPFKDYEQAKLVLQETYRWYHRDHKHEFRKMKDHYEGS